MLKPYFPKCKDQPEPLQVCVERTVRFEEVDPLGIVWHGRYASYFEDARVVLGEKYGIGYMDLFYNGILAPIKNMHIDFKSPLKFKEEVTIEGILHFSEASRINIEYIIRDREGKTAYCLTMQTREQHI